MAENTAAKPEAKVEEPEEFDIIKALEKDAAEKANIPDSGVSDAPEDNLVPFIYILQSNSPQVVKKTDAYIEGAEPGSIWLRNAARPMVSGEEGILFQCVHFYKNWVAFTPRSEGGGFQGTFKEVPPDAITRQEDGRERIILPEQNWELIEYRYHAGFVHEGAERLPYIIPFKSTGHTVSKNWMPHLRRLNPAGERSKSYHSLFLLTTVRMVNKKGQWYNLKVDLAKPNNGWISSLSDLRNGIALQQSLVTGARQAETPMIEHMGEKGDDIPF